MVPADQSSWTICFSLTPTNSWSTGRSELRVGSNLGFLCHSLHSRSSLILSRKYKKENQSSINVDNSNSIKCEEWRPLSLEIPTIQLMPFPKNYIRCFTDIEENSYKKKKKTRSLPNAFQFYTPIRQQFDVRINTTLKKFKCTTYLNLTELYHCFR